MKKAMEILRREGKLIMMHRGADPDALGSAIAISRVFGGAIDITGGINRIAKRLFDIFDIKWVETPEFNDYDTVIVLDTASPSQLYSLPERISLVIDHHMDSREWNNAECKVIDENAPSCTQILKKILDDENIDIDRETALALLIGMYTDTKRFSMGDATLLKDAGECMEKAGVDINFLKEFVKDEGQPLRISIMKGLQRLRFRIYRNHIIVWTKVGSYEGAVANRLVEIGADIALVGSEKDGFVRVTGRASNSIVKKGLHLGRIFSSMGYAMDGEGGGHDGAAGFTAVGDVEYILKICVSRLESEIAERIK